MGEHATLVRWGRPNVRDTESGDTPQSMASDFAGCRPQAMPHHRTVVVGPPSFKCTATSSAARVATLRRLQAGAPRDARSIFSLSISLTST
jgi:hypothetical protein